PFRIVELRMVGDAVATRTFAEYAPPPYSTFTWSRRSIASSDLVLNDALPLWPGAGVALLVVNRIGCAVVPAATSAPLAVELPTNSPVDAPKRSVAPGLMVSVDGEFASFATVTLPRMAYGIPRLPQVASAASVSPTISTWLAL